MQDAFIRAGRRALGFGDGDICPQCEAAWVRSRGVSGRIIAGAADRYGALLADREEVAREPGVWSPTAYTVHVGDWLRIWAERLVAVGAEPARPLPSVDQDVLAAARAYGEVSDAAALHVLASGARELLEVAERVGSVTFEHPDFGPADTEAILSWLAHEVDHHAWDVGRLRGGSHLRELR